MRTMTTVKGTMLALGVCAVVGMIPNRSEAAVVDVRFATPVVYGHETRHERVLVAPEHHERRWIAPVYRTTCEPCGEAGRVLVHAGYWEDYCVPARYEDRCVQVEQPVCYETFGRTYFGGRFDLYHNNHERFERHERRY